MAADKVRSLNLERFRCTYDNDREANKPNGKPIIRSSDYGTPAFETGYDLANVIGNPERCLMQCGVCLCLPRYPIELQSCGHIFCFMCAMRTINFQPMGYHSTGAPCPTCKSHYYISNIVDIKRSSQALLNIYNGFDIRCGYGCGQVCSPKLMMDHETWVCPRRPVRCIFDSCDTILPDTEMEAHLDECSQRLVYCNGCYLPRKLDGSDHSCAQSSRQTIRGTHAHTNEKFLI